MITEETLEFETLEAKTPLRVSEIEDFIRKKGIEPVRFSVISRNSNKIKLGVSGIKK